MNYCLLHLQEADRAAKAALKADQGTASMKQKGPQISASIQVRVDSEDFLTFNNMFQHFLNVGLIFCMIKK